jgi:hypothetical protein
MSNKPNQEELYQTFEKAVLTNIAADLDIRDEKYEFWDVINNYGQYFEYLYSEDKNKQNTSANMIKSLFTFLFEEVGGSRSDYLASAIGNAVYDSNILLKIKDENLNINSEFSEKSMNRIYETALIPNKAIDELKSYGLFANN